MYYTIYNREYANKGGKSEFTCHLKEAVPSLTIMAGNDTFLSNMKFENELEELEKKGNPMAVSIFLAREVHAMCKVCQEHTTDIKVLKELHPSKRESLITGASGGAVATVVFGIIYGIGKWLHFWD